MSAFDDQWNKALSFDLETFRILNKAYAGLSFEIKTTEICFKRQILEIFRKLIFRLVAIIIYIYG